LRCRSPIPTTIARIAFVDMNPVAGVRYREATVADVAEIARSRLADPEAGRADPRMAAYLQGTHHPQRALAPRVAYVALHDPDVAGYIAGHLTRRYDCDGEVQYLFVAPRHRRSGVGSELLRRLARWFAEQGAFRICVDVDADSPSARPFYTGHGATRLNDHWLVWEDIRTLLPSGMRGRLVGQ